MAIITELLSSIFGISPVQVSQIINTRVKMVAATLRPLIFRSSKQVIRQHLKSLEDYQHLRCTIDCTLIFIEHPRDLELQAIKWSDYKKNTTQ